MNEANNDFSNILPDLERKAGRSSRHNSNHNSNHNMRNSSRSSRRENIMISSKTLGSQGNGTEATMSIRSSGSESSSSSQNISCESSSNSLNRDSRHNVLIMLDELQEKVARMNALSSGQTLRRRSTSCDSSRSSSRRSHGSSNRRSSSLSSSERSGGSPIITSSEMGSGRISSRRSSTQRSSSSRHGGTKQEHSREGSFSSDVTGASSRFPRDDPPVLPSRTRSPSSPEKPRNEPLKWTSHQSPDTQLSSMRRSPSNGAGSANGSFQVTHRRNISLSSPSSSKSRGRRRSAQHSSSSVAQDNPTPDVATIESENDPLRDIAVPGACSVDSSGQISLLSTPSHHRSSSISLDGSFQSAVSSLSSSSSHHHQRSLDVSSRGPSSSSHHRHDTRSRRSQRNRRRSLDSSTRSSSSQSSLQSWPEEEEQDDDVHSFTDGHTVTSRSVASYSILRSVNEDPEEETAIAASVAQDLQEELEEARAQGRQEALTEGTRHNSGDILVLEACSDDESSQGSELADEKRRRKVICWVVLLCCLALVFGIGVTALLFFQREGGMKEQIIINDEDFDSNLKGVIVFTPPTQEECEAIANGLFLEDQTLLIHKCFHMQIDITLASDSDFGSLSGDLVRHIQQTLLPIMAGCQSFDFVDATIVIGDGTTATNATGAIANGQIQEGTVSVCEADPIGNCNSFKLILDLYLDEDRSDAILVETIGKTVTSDEIANALGPLYPVQGVSDLSIVPVILPIIDGPTPSPTHT